MGEWDGIEGILTGVPRMRRGERVRYVPSRRGFGAFMKSDQMRDVTAEVAQDIAVAAALSVPAPSAGTDPRATAATYKVKRAGGIVKVSGNLRVRVYVLGQGGGVERAEFGTDGTDRYRTLARAGMRFGDFKHGEAVQ